MKIIRKKIIAESEIKDEFLNCFGNFRLGDKICYRHCALSIKCFIRKEKLLEAEFIEDFLETEALASLGQ